MTIWVLLVEGNVSPLQLSQAKHRGTAWRGQACAGALALLLGYFGAAEEFRIGGSGAALGTMQLLAAGFTATNPEIRITTVPSLGSGGSIKAVLSGAIGLAVTSRALNESERKLGAVEVEYPYYKRLFLVTGAKRSLAVERFIAFVQSSAGRKTLAANGQWIP